MSEEQLTVEKVKAGKDGTGHNVGMFVTGNEAWLHQEAIDFLLSQIATIERDTAEKCAEIACSKIKFNPMPGYDHGFHFCAKEVKSDIRDHFNLGEKP